MFKLTITKADNSLYGIEHFNTEVEAQAWIDKEVTRNYWPVDNNYSIEEVIIVPPVLTLEQEVANKVQEAIAFGNALIAQIAVENILLGITQDGMTGIVRKAMAESISALTTGSLYDAINELRAIPIEKKDAKYITDERLLAAINKIETYLNISLSQTL